MALIKALFQPPARLRALPENWCRLLRPLWILSILASIAIVALGTVQALRETYEVRPAFATLGLDYDVEDNGKIWVKIVTDRPPAISPGAQFQIAAINGSPVSANIRTNKLSHRLAAAEGPNVALGLRTRDGRLLTLNRTRDSSAVDPSARRARDLRVAARLTSGLLACTALLLCSFLLGRRRPGDPVALLLAFAFAGMAATIDPPLSMWMAMGWPIAYDVISSVWFYLLLIALATFPDGIFVPKPYRWLLPGAIPLAVFVSLHDVNPDIQVFVGIGALLAMLVGQFRRYRRLKPGIERQQIKWAAFGFASGFLLIFAAFVLLLFLPDDPTKQSMLLTMAIVLTFSLGMAAIPLGLLIALTRFRLWEADTVITRSAAYAVVAIVVGVVWAASSDLVKMVIVEVIGHESEAGATTVGAVIAAGVFSPTQSLVLDWTKRHFGGPLDQIHDAAKRLKNWGLTEPPAEVATRALAIIDQAVHPVASAIVLDTALSHELIAAREVTSAEDPRLIERLTLEDEESSVGTLLLGRRSDGNRYNRQELEAIREIIPSLAEALRVARGRYSRENMMQQRLDEMAARLAQLEGGAPKPA
jgi:hypothetical protein